MIWQWYCRNCQRFKLNKDNWCSERQIHCFLAKRHTTSTVGRGFLDNWIPGNRGTYILFGLFPPPLLQPGLHLRRRRLGLINHSIPRENDGTVAFKLHNSMDLLPVFVCLYISQVLYSEINFYIKYYVLLYSIDVVSTCLMLYLCV